MRKEVELWITQAKNDLRAAQKNKDIQEYNVSVFLSQQACEKALKAYYFFVKKENPGLTHSLIYLAQQTNIPKKHHTFLRNLMTQFTATRYPDAAFGVPSELYDESFASEIYTESEVILKWIYKKLE